MRYTAAALTHAARPVTITIGRASSRRGWRRLSVWWIRHARTWTLPPLSVEQMLSLQASRGDPVEYLVALAPVLRALLPRRWWHRVTGDPVALLLRLPPELLQRVLGRLVTMPDSNRDATHEHDPFAALRALQRRAVSGDRTATGPAPTLAIAALTAREALGEAWYYAPNRWPTTDGYVPFAVAWLVFVGLSALGARRVLERADGYLIANAKDARRARQDLTRAAYPSDSLH